MRDNLRDPTELVAAGYDAAGDRYTRAARHLNDTKDRHTRVVLDRVVTGGRVLDLGCGAGEPTTATLAERFHVIGVDVSRRQLRKAQDAVPEARFVLGDMSRLGLVESTFDAVVAYYSIIHVPRERHEHLFDSIRSWLRPGGLLVASMASAGSDAWIEDFYGAPMYWSGFDAETNKRMLRDAGFLLESAGLITDTFQGESETHLWVVAERPG